MITILGVITAALTALVTVLIGWQIFTVIKIDCKIKTATKKIEANFNELETRFYAGIIQSSCLSKQYALALHYLFELLSKGHVENKEDYIEFVIDNLKKNSPLKMPLAMRERCLQQLNDARLKNIPLNELRAIIETADTH